MQKYLPCPQLLWLLLLLFPLSQQTKATQQEAPALLNYDELGQLSQPATPLRDKLVRLLSTPFVDNGAARRGIKPLKPDLPRLGKSLRVVFWNIERGLNYEAIAAALGDAEKFARLLDKKKYPPGSKKQAELLQQAEEMKKADVIVLNEVDWGLPITGMWLRS